MVAQESMQSIKRFIAKHKLSMSVDWADRNPNMADDEWSRTANHYKCVLKQGRKRMTTYFSMGTALRGEPEIASVLDTLAMDASSVVNNATFEDFCGEYGYDTDSRRAERMYKVMQRQEQRLRAFLGNEATEELFWETEGA